MVLSTFRYDLKLAFLAIALIACGSANDSPGFFLKVTKNVPRLGRRAEPLSGPDVEDSFAWLNDQMHSHQGGGITKRMLLNPAALAAAAEREYSVVQPVSSNTLYRLLERDLSDNLNFVFWKDFDRALQMDSELYEKVISLGRKADQSLKADLHMNHFANGPNGNALPERQHDAGGAGDFMYYPPKDMSDLYGSRYAGGFMQNRL